MNRKWMGALLGAAVALAFGACGKSGGGNDTVVPSGSSPGTGTENGGGDEAAPPSTETGPCTGVTVRMLGVNPGAVTQLGVVVGGVSVMQGGSPLDATEVPLGTTIDLATEAAAPVVARFGLAAGDAPLQVTVWLSGGSSARDGLSGPLDVCAAPISFTLAPGRLVWPSCQLRILLDVARSVIGDGDGALAFVPQYRVFSF